MTKKKSVTDKLPAGDPQQSVTKNEKQAPLKPKSKGGRPSLANLVDLQHVEKLAMQGMSGASIARCLNVCPQTVHNNRQRSKDFDEAIERGRAKGIAMITNKLYMAALEEKDPRARTTAQIFFLKCQAGWNDRAGAELAVTINSQTGAQQSGPIDEMSAVRAAKIFVERMERKQREREKQAGQAEGPAT